MIAGFELTKDFIQFEKEVSNWEEAIIKSAEPLLKQGLVEQSYIDAMISSVKKHGPYIVIAPNIAMPHARPEAGSKSVGFSVLKLEKPVAFSEAEEHKAQLLIALSCANSNTHLEVLQSLVTILSDEEKHNLIFSAKNAEEMLKAFV
ncbi:PTS sugar transporter subunit IIA [Haloimpatiens sp. FM7330]|uniref:PTS sugar transporter subunit IIA n=1 Tax=Haloimpatiens sp. FM7330 TaxID=3298610 RepID=UPI0036302B4C